MKVVVNKCFGGFSLSALATKEYYKRKGKECYLFKDNYETDIRELVAINIEDADFFYHAYSVPNPQDYRDKDFKDIYLSNHDIERTDPDLVAVVEMLGKEADGSCAELEIVEIPDDVDYYIHEYDGMESIHENHRSW